MHDMRPRLAAPLLVGVGAASDFHAGIVSQAPGWMQRAGLEWLYLLTREPRRLWRRYASQNPRFLVGFLRQYLLRRRGGPGLPAERAAAGREGGHRLLFLGPADRAGALRRGHDLGPRQDAADRHRISGHEHTCIGVGQHPRA